MSRCLARSSSTPWASSSPAQLRPRRATQQQVSKTCWEVHLRNGVAASAAAALLGRGSAGAVTYAPPAGRRCRRLRVEPRESRREVSSTAGLCHRHPLVVGRLVGHDLVAQLLLDLAVRLVVSSMVSLSRGRHRLEPSRQARRSRRAEWTKTRLTSMMSVVVWEACRSRSPPRWGSPPPTAEEQPQNRQTANGENLR